jgi:hypothetical protein
MGDDYNATADAWASYQEKSQSLFEGVTKGGTFYGKK